MKALPAKWKRERAASLGALGMRDYVDYLASPLWASIRRRVYARANGVCESKGCSARPSAIHHWSYALRVMQGATLKGLQAVCKRCHKRIHGAGETTPQQKAKRVQRAALKAYIASGGAVAQPMPTTTRLVRKRAVA